MGGNLAERLAKNESRHVFKWIMNRFVLIACASQLNSENLLKTGKDGLNRFYTHCLRITV